MSNVNELKLLAGLPIEIAGVGKIKQLKLKELAELGEDVYQQYLSVLCFNIDDLDIDVDIPELETFDVIVSNCIHGEEFKTKVIKGLTLFFGETVSFIKEYGLFYLGEIDDQRFIHKQNYEEIKNIIKIVNCIEKNQNVSNNPTSDKAKELIDKLKKAREKVNKIKNKNTESDEVLSFADLVSILCANGNGINVFNVWDMTFYTFNNQFNRMKLLEEYDINIRSLLAGAKQEDIQLKHWMTKI